MAIAIDALALWHTFIALIRGSGGLLPEGEECMAGKGLCLGLAFSSSSSSSSSKFLKTKEQFRAGIRGRETLRHCQCHLHQELSNSPPRALESKRYTYAHQKYSSSECLFNRDLLFSKLMLLQTSHETHARECVCVGTDRATLAILFCSRFFLLRSSFYAVLSRWTNTGFVLLLQIAHSKMTLD